MSNCFRRLLYKGHVELLALEHIEISVIVITFTQHQSRSISRGARRVEFST